MATKNIKKILLNKNGNNFVVDTENIVRSVNGVNADEDGNIELALPFVKTVNSTAPDSNGNVVLDLSSSSGGVGFPDFSAGVAISNFNGGHTNDTRTYTLTSNGWVIGSLTFEGYNGGCNVAIYINNALQKSFSPSNTIVDYYFSVPLKSGTQIKIQFQYSGSGVDVSGTLNFYPFLS